MSANQFELEAEEEAPERYEERIRKCGRCVNEFLSVPRKEPPQFIPLFCEHCAPFMADEHRRAEQRLKLRLRDEWERTAEAKRNRPKKARQRPVAKRERAAAAPEPPGEPDAALEAAADMLLRG